MNRHSLMHNLAGTAHVGESCLQEFTLTNHKGTTRWNIGRLVYTASPNCRVTNTHVEARWIWTSRKPNGELFQRFQGLWDAPWNRDQHLKVVALP
jgi:hypothetical protein